MSGAGAPPSVAVWVTSPRVSSSRLLFDRCSDGGGGGGSGGDGGGGSGDGPHACQGLEHLPLWLSG